MIDKEFRVPGCRYVFNTNSPIDDALITSIMVSGYGVVNPPIPVNRDPLPGQRVTFTDDFYGSISYTYIAQLNVGSENSIFGKIWKVQEDRTGLFHVVKIQAITPDLVRVGEDKNAFKEYIKQWLIYTITTNDTIDCPHTAPTYGFFFQTDGAGSIWTYQLMSLIEGQNFDKFLATEFYTVKFNEICHNIGRKINTLQNWITFYHCDLHDRNVRLYMQGGYWNVVFIDFGSSYMKVGKSVIKNTAVQNNNISDVEARTDLKKLDLATLYGCSYESNPGACRTGSSLKWPFNYVIPLLLSLPITVAGARRFHTLYDKDVLSRYRFPTEPDNISMLNPDILSYSTHEKKRGPCSVLSGTIPVSTGYVYTLHPIKGNPFRPLIVEIAGKITDLDAIIAKARGDIDALKITLAQIQATRKANIVANINTRKANRKFLEDDEARRELEQKTREALQRKSLALALLVRPSANKADLEAFVRSIVMEPPVLPKPSTALPAPSATGTATTALPAPSATGTAATALPAPSATGTATTAFPAPSAAGTATTGATAVNARAVNIRKLFQLGGGFQIELRDGTKVTVPDNISGFGLIAMSELYPRNPVFEEVPKEASVANEMGAEKGGSYKRTRRGKKQRKSSRKYRILK